MQSIHIRDLLNILFLSMSEPCFLCPSSPGMIQYLFPLMDPQRCPLKIDQLLHSNKKSGYTLFYSEFKIQFKVNTTNILCSFKQLFPLCFISSFGEKLKDFWGTCCPVWTNLDYKGGIIWTHRPDVHWHWDTSSCSLQTDKRPITGLWTHLSRPHRHECW